MKGKSQEYEIYIYIVLLYTTKQSIKAQKKKGDFDMFIYLLIHL